MADAPARTELKVTTGPIRGSRKIYVGQRRRDARGRPRALVGRAAGHPLRHQRPLHRPATPASTSWPACPSFAPPWIRGRGDVEEVAQREVRPEDNGQLGPDRSGGVAPFPNVRKRVLRAKPGANVTPDALRPPRHHHARNGICRAPRESRPRSTRSTTSATARTSAPPSPTSSPPNSSATRSPAAAPSSPTTSTTPRSEPMAIGRNFLVKINANIGN